MSMQDKLEMLAKAKALMTPVQNDALDKLVKKVVISHWLKTMTEALGDGGAKDWILIDFVDTQAYPGSYCTCGQAIRYEYHIEHQATKEKLIVGSSCITTHTSITPQVVNAVKKGVKEVTDLRDEVAEAVVKAGGWAEWAVNHVELIDKFLILSKEGAFKLLPKIESLIKFLLGHGLPIPDSYEEAINKSYESYLEGFNKPQLPAGIKAITASNDWGKCSHSNCAAPDIKKGQMIYKKEGKWYHAACPTSLPQPTTTALNAPTPTVPTPSPAKSVPEGAKMLTAGYDGGKCSHAHCSSPNIKKGQEIYKLDGKWFHVECPTGDDKPAEINLPEQTKTSKPAKVTIPTWLAKEKGCSTVMEGEIINETYKSVYFKGNCVVVDNPTHCLCCKKPLTHQVSILTGYGPECAKNIGVDHPGYNKKDFTPAEIEEIKSMIKAVTFEGWLPKSKTEIKELDV